MLLYTVLLLLVALNFGSALNPKSASKWPIQAEHVPLSGNPSSAPGKGHVLRLSPEVPMWIDEIYVKHGSTVKKGDTLMRVVVRGKGDTHTELYVEAPASGIVEKIHVKEKEMIWEMQPLIDITEQNPHSKPVPFDPSPQHLTPNYGSRPNRRRPSGYRSNSESVNGGDTSANSSDLNMLD